MNDDVTIRLDSLFKEEASNYKINDQSEEEKIGQVTDKDKLNVAREILTGLAVIFVLCCILYLIDPEHGSVLLEICKTTIPPLATLIIAFYFKS